MHFPCRPVNYTLAISFNNPSILYDWIFFRAMWSLNVRLLSNIISKTLGSVYVPSRPAHLTCPATRHVYCAELFQAWGHSTVVIQWHKCSVCEQWRRLKVACVWERSFKLSMNLKGVYDSMSYKQNRYIASPVVGLSMLICNKKHQKKLNERLKYAYIKYRSEVQVWREGVASWHRRTEITEISVCYVKHNSVIQCGHCFRFTNYSR